VDIGRRFTLFTLVMGEESSSETSVNIYHTTTLNIAEDGYLSSYSSP
jgi:hypothetical protein